MEQIDTEVKYYQKIFKSVIDLAEISTETFLKYFVLEMENMAAEKRGKQVSADTVFQLLGSVRKLKDIYAKHAPSVRFGMKPEKWFASYVEDWIETLPVKTTNWVDAAVSKDNVNIYI